MPPYNNSYKYTLNLDSREVSFKKCHGGLRPVRVTATTAAASIEY